MKNPDMFTSFRRQHLRKWTAVQQMISLTEGKEREAGGNPFLVSVKPTASTVIEEYRDSSPKGRS